jgi:hypothetical protein
MTQSGAITPPSLKFVKLSAGRVGLAGHLPVTRQRRSSRVTAGFREATATNLSAHSGVPRA